MTNLIYKIKSKIFSQSIEAKKYKRPTYDELIQYQDYNRTKNNKLFLSFGSGRSGQNWFSKLFNSHKNWIGSAERFADYEAFYRYITYYKIPISKTGFFNLLKGSQSLIVIYKDWLKIWKLRNNNNLQQIKRDAEDITLKKDNLISIGGKIENLLPKYQYMGILKFKYKDFININNYFKTLKNKKIDFTSFINLALKEKIIKIKVKKTNKFWLEIDNQKDFFEVLVFLIFVQIVKQIDYFQAKIFHI